jgi:hypothetical protein
LRQGFGYLFVRSGDNQPERLARNAHLFRSLFLVEFLVISQPDGFQFIGGQFDRFKHSQWNSLRLEVSYRRAMADPAFFLRSWHGLLIAYANNKKQPAISFFQGLENLN